MIFLCGVANLGEQRVAEEVGEHGPDRWIYVASFPYFDQPPILIEPIDLIEGERTKRHHNKFEW
jgi:hypothetical protein